MDTYLCASVCVREGEGGSSLCSFLHKRWHIGAVWTLIPHQDRVGLKRRKTRKKRKYIYNSILCRIFIGLLCRWSYAPHWPRPALSTMWSLDIVLYRWLVADCFGLFFHVKCIFRNKCLCFKRDFLCVLLQLLQQNESVGWKGFCALWRLANSLPV